jgi:ankyrin repeat protein
VQHTALRGAGNYGHEAVVEVLLAAGADVNLASYAGRTPLMGVAMNGHVPLVRRFLGAGAQLKRPQERTREREREEREGLVDSHLEVRRREQREPFRSLRTL